MQIYPSDCFGHQSIFYYDVRSCDSAVLVCKFNNEQIRLYAIDYWIDNECELYFSTLCSAFIEFQQYAIPMVWNCMPQMQIYLFMLTILSAIEASDNAWCLKIDALL